MIQFDPDSQSYYEMPDDATSPGVLHPPLSGAGPLAPAPGTPGLAYTPGQGATAGGGYGTAPPIDRATGTYPAGWAQRDDGLWYFTDPSSGGAPSGPSGSGGLTPPSTAGGWYPQFTAPKFQAPTPFAFPDFKAPTMAEAEAEPGFAFALDQGRKALENSAAGKGVLRTGGTLKDILGYGQKLGEQNYGNVFGRAKDVYGLNRGNAADTYATNYGVSRDVFDRTYQGALDEYKPKAREAELNQTQDFQTWLAKLGVAQNLFGAGQD